MTKVREGSSGIQYFMSNCVSENDFYFVLVSLAQVVWTIHKICTVRGLNPSQKKKKKDFYFDFIIETKNKMKHVPLKNKTST